MGKDTRNQDGSAVRLDEAADKTHYTLAQRIMQCGDYVIKACAIRGTLSQETNAVVNGLIVDCVADCIDILRKEKHDARIDNS